MPPNLKELYIFKGSTFSHVYTWGSNKHGQCGVGTKEDISTPVRLVLSASDLCRKD